MLTQPIKSLRLERTGESRAPSVLRIGISRARGSAARAVTAAAGVVGGDADRVLPYDKTGARLPGLIKDVRLVTIEGGPHAIAWTHTDDVNRALLDFLA